MDRFTQLISQGIAPNRYDAKYIGNTPNTDPFVRGYNNVWGVVSDTHMASYGEDQYIITGSMVQNQSKFSQFLYASSWGGYSFNATEAAKVNGIRSLSGYLYSNGLVGSFGKVNNDDVYIISPIENLRCCPCVTAYGCCDKTACESIHSIFKDEDTMKQVLAEGTSQEIIDRLNKSKDVNGNQWILCGDADGLKFVNENRKYILFQNEEH